MAHHTKLAREIDTLEKLLAQIAAATQCGDATSRFELVSLRRELANCIATIGRIAEPTFAGTAEFANYRTKFARMRSMTAIHQASWPAILLGERTEEFRASTRPMREANREFISWAREALARLP